jgi:hypothetical protein
MVKTFFLMGIVDHPHEEQESEHNVLIFNQRC